MTNLETNISNALLDAKEVLIRFIEIGSFEAKHIFGLSEMLSKKYSLSQDQSIFIIEQANSILLKSE